MFHLAFERPMKSYKTGAMIPLGDYIKEINDAFQSELAGRLLEIKRKYLTKGIPIRTKIVVGGSGSISGNIGRFADKEGIDLIVVGNVGLGEIAPNKFCNIII